MGDFKCKAGVTPEEKDINNTLNDSYRSDDSKVNDSYRNDSYRSDDNVNNTINNNFSNESQDVSSDCGCGSKSSKDYSSSDFSDDVQFPDDADSAVIYSETIIFTDPYAGVNDDPATSDLVDDAQEGSEYISSNPNKERPQC